MIKQTTTIFLLTCIMMVWSLTGCSNSDTKTIIKTIVDTSKDQTTSPLRKDSVVYVKKDSTTLILSNTEEIKVSKKVKNPFLKLDYDKVVAYDYESRMGERVMDIITDGKLAPTVKQQKELTQEQIDGFTDYMGAPSTYGSGYAFCFEPHLGIVFYKNDKIVAHLSICLECNRLSSSIKIPATEVTKIKIDDDYEYPAEGFSKSGRQKISSLCYQLNFSHCKDRR